MTVRIVFVALLASLCVACRSSGARDFNLRKLHDLESGRHRLVAQQAGDFEYLLRSSQLFGSNGLQVLENKTPEAIEKPGGRCLELLNDLADFDSSDPRVAALQVDWFAFAAAEDPWTLSRERAAIELGAHGRRVGLERLGVVTRDEGAIGPGELLEVLRGLLDALQPVVEGEASSSTALDVEAACEVLRERPLDLDGARRALRATAALLAAGNLERPELAPLRDLVRYLEQTCIEQALARALNDPEPVVRAAAVEGAVLALGNAVLPQFLAQVRLQEDSRVLQSILGLVVREGLPEVPADMPADEAQDLRLAWYSILWRFSRHPEGSVRAAAMQALGAVSGTGIESLREEEWQAWWSGLQEQVGASREDGAQPEASAAPAADEGGKGAAP